MYGEEPIAYLASIVDSTDDAILSTNWDKVIVSWNQGAERLFGYSATEIIGRSIATLVPPERTGEAFGVLERILRGETVESFETERVHKDGRRIPVSLTVSPIRNTEGISGACAIARDITDRKREQEALRRSAAELREAQRIGQVGSWQFIPDTNTWIWSEETYRILGVDPARFPLSNEEQSRIFTTESWTRAVAALDCLLATGTPYELDLEFRHPDGSQRWLTARGEAVRDTTRSIVMLRGTIQDITARRRTEQALRERDRELEEAQAVANVGNWKWDPKTDTVVWSEELHRIFGHDSKLPAPSFAQHPAIISPNAMPELEVLVKRALDTGQPYDFDMEILRPDGAIRWVVVRGLADRDAQGRVVGLHGTVQDITERKGDAEQLRRLNENLESLVAERTSELQAILDAAPIPIWIAHDPQCRRVTGNVHADQIVMRVPRGANISASALPGEASVSYKVFRNGREMQPEELPAQMAAASGRPVVGQEVDLAFPDGRTVSLLLFAAPLFDGEGRVRGAVTAGADLTGVRAAEHLRDSIPNSLSASVAVIAPDGTILTTNEAWNRFAKENGDPQWAAVGPGANYLEVCKRAADEGVFDAQLALDAIQGVLAGHRSSVEFEYGCHSSTQQRWFLMTVVPLRGTNTGAVITHTNITDRKLAEIAVQTSESTIRGLLDSSTQSVVAVNSDAMITLVNGNTEKMFGYTRAELLGKPLEILIPEGFRAGHAVHYKGYLANPQSRPMGIGIDLKGRRKDGATFPVEVGLSPVETMAGKLAVAFVSDITQRKRLEEAERAHAQQVQALAASLLTAQEEERRKVSRELHDQICQQLSSLAFDIGGLAADPPPPEEAQIRLKSVQERVVKASEETRHIAYQMHPSILDDLGLAASLRDLCEQFSERARDVELRFAEDALPGSLPIEVAACLYRVAQESLQNIVKHTSAKHVSVKLTMHKGVVALTIADDGTGFDQAAVKGRGGLGLIGMEERARLVNGKLSIAARPGRGTRIAVKVPLPAL